MTEVTLRITHPVTRSSCAHTGTEVECLMWALDWAGVEYKWEDSDGSTYHE